VGSKDNVVVLKAAVLTGAVADGVIAIERFLSKYPPALPGDIYFGRMSGNGYVPDLPVKILNFCFGSHLGHLARPNICHR
jgi:hypothetical protein